MWMIWRVMKLRLANLEENDTLAMGHAARIVVPHGKFWNPRPMLLFPTPGHCSPWRVFVPHLVFGFPVQAVSPSNLNQIR